MAPPYIHARNWVVFPVEKSGSSPIPTRQRNAYATNAQRVYIHISTYPYTKRMAPKGERVPSLIIPGGQYPYASSASLFYPTRTADGIEGAGRSRSGAAGSITDLASHHSSCPGAERQPQGGFSRLLYRLGSQSQRDPQDGSDAGDRSFCRECQSSGE